MHNLAVYVHSLYPGSSLAFISPCLAKRREFQSSKIVDYNITFQSLAHIFKNRNINLEHFPPGEFDNPVAAGIASNFCTPRGFKESYLYRYPETPPSSITKIEGPIVYQRYLEDLSRAINTGKTSLPMIVDILSCQKGCNMGAGCINFHKTIDEIEMSVAQRSENSINNKENESDFGYLCT